MKWFKFYGQDYLSDPKMLSLTACERSCWITILSYSSINDNGMITFLAEEQLMIQSGLTPSEEDWDKTKGILQKLQKLKMINNDNGVITVCNWGKRQETNLTSYQRVKRFREKKRNDNTMITLDKKRIEENRRDKKRKEEINTNTPEPKGSEEVVELIKAFEEINPACKRMYGNTTQRRACTDLIQSYGFERVKNVISSTLPRTNKISYMPTITTPNQLFEKWSSLEAGIIKLNDKKQSKGGIADINKQNI
jgi:hypothetical protein